MANPLDYLIEHLSRHHRREDFDCGKAPLNRYLQRYASQNDRNNISRAFVAIDAEQRVWGYFAISAASVSASAFPPDTIKRLPRYPVPVALIAQLAVDNGAQGTGLGSRLLIEAFKRIANALEQMAIRAVMVDAIDEDAQLFYRKYGFISFVDNPMKLFLPIETVVEAVK